MKKRTLDRIRGLILLDKAEREKLELEDKLYLWHPFTQMQDWLAEKPLVVERGEGNYLVDVEGNRYLDGVSSLWTNVHGHRRAELDRAIIEQVGKLSHSTLLGLASVPAIKLAARLIGIAPGSLRKVFYSDDGSTAVEISLKMAYQYWQQQKPPRRSKRKFISFVNGYHGDTLGAVSVGGIDLFHSTYRPLLFETVKVQSAYCYRCYKGLDYSSCRLACLGDVEEALATHKDEAAALIMEPVIQAAGGMIAFPPGYTRAVWRLAQKYGLLFIADEVATGFGRTGSMFACEREGVKPDLMNVAKGITGGYLPLAATLASQEVFDAFYGDYREQKAFFHGHTYTGNPLACAAALANLDIFETDNILEKLKDKIAFLEAGLKAFRDLEHVGDIRQAGLMVGMELVKDRDTREPYAYEDKVGIRVCQKVRSKGLILRPLGDVIVLLPPLSITGEELSRILDITFHSLKAVTG